MTIEHNLRQVLQNIIVAERQFARKPGSVQLLAVSKAQPVERIRAAFAAGQLDFGENYVQEALAKITVLAAENCKINWHFIGNIQSNKIKAIAQHFAWAHGVASLAHAEQLSMARPRDLPPLNVCIQVNVDDEKTKSGVNLKELLGLAHAIAHLPCLVLRGLMVIPAPREDFNEQRAAFAKVRLALEKLCNEGLALDTLSMGMSGDFVAAIAEGATIVRVGTAIFGERK